VRGSRDQPRHPEPRVDDSPRPFLRHFSVKIDRLESVPQVLYPVIGLAAVATPVRSTGYRGRKPALRGVRATTRDRTRAELARRDPVGARGEDPLTWAT
jgi:hypothetical protein